MFSPWAAVSAATAKRPDNEYSGTMVYRLLNRSAAAFALIAVLLLAAGPFLAPAQTASHACCPHSSPFKGAPAKCCVVAPHDAPAMVSAPGAGAEYLPSQTASVQSLPATDLADSRPTRTAPASPPGRILALRI